MSGWAGFKQQGKIDEKMYFGHFDRVSPPCLHLPTESAIWKHVWRSWNTVSPYWKAAAIPSKSTFSVQIPPCMYAALRLFRRRLRQAIGMKAWRKRKCVRRATAKLRQCFAEMRQSDAENSIDVSVGRIKKRIRSLASVSVFLCPIFHASGFRRHWSVSRVLPIRRLRRFFAPEDAGQRLRR